MAAASLLGSAQAAVLAAIARALLTQLLLVEEGFAQLVTILPCDGPALTREHNLHAFGSDLDTCEKAVAGKANRATAAMQKHKCA